MSRRVSIAGSVLGLVLVCTACPVLEAFAQEAGDEAPKPPPPAAEESPSKIKALIGYGLSIAGVFVVTAIVLHTLSKTMKYEPARNALIHLLRTAPNQAEMQCQTMPHSFYDPIGACLKAGAMTATQDPAIIASATVPTYDALGAVVVQHWKGLVGKAKLAMMASIGGIAVRPSPLPVILGIVAFAGLAWLWYYKSEVDRSIFRAKVEVLPEVDRAFVDGRYYIAPKA
ncbi:MAG: hypothetical protein ABI867_16995 [Kofleriaceae bacterium]